jgi:RNA polymerase sigma-70 factor, ECF subfamily
MRNKEQPHDPEVPIRLATFDQYRGLLFSVAYRMLGTVADAEDMLQETFIRWQQAPDEEIRSPRAFLVTIISRLCINHLQSARVQREEYVGQWLPEPIPTDPGNDPLGLIRIDESLSMAFLVLLERLTPVERAVFLLREVFEYEYSEIAGVLDQSEANCRQILRRARQHVSAMRPRFKASARKQSDLLERFLQATTSGDLDGLVALLSSDVVLHSDGGGKSIAVPNVVRGVDKVARGMLGAMRKLVPKDLVRCVSQINGAPGVVTYLNGKPFSVLTFDATEERIRAIYIVTNPEKLSHLPEMPANPS